MLLKGYVNNLNLLYFPKSEGFRLEGTSGGHLVQPPAQAGTPGAGCPGPCTGGFRRAPRRQTPQLTASLGNPCQCSITHTVRKCFLMISYTSKAVLGYAFVRLSFCLGQAQVQHPASLSFVSDKHCRAGRIPADALLGWYKPTVSQDVWLAFSRFSIFADNFYNAALATRSRSNEDSNTAVAVACKSLQANPWPGQQPTHLPSSPSATTF